MRSGEHRRLHPHLCCLCGDSCEAGRGWARLGEAGTVEILSEVSPAWQSQQGVCLTWQLAPLRVLRKTQRKFARLLPNHRTASAKFPWWHKSLRPAQVQGRIRLHLFTGEGTEGSWPLSFTAVPNTVPVVTPTPTPTSTL